MAEIECPIWTAILDGRGVKYNSRKSWIMDINDRWVRADDADVHHNASVISEAEFERIFPEAGPLPKDAFKPF